jgi:hypothetical protein
MKDAGLRDRDEDAEEAKDAEVYGIDLCAL